MGTDIELFAEQRAAGRWVSVLGIEPNGEPMTESDTIEPPYRPIRLWTDRVYPVFATLAGVRDSHGIDPIAAPRGLPDDVSEEVQTWARFWPDMHSAGWLSVAEILSHEQPRQDRSLLQRVLLGPSSSNEEWSAFVSEVISPLLTRGSANDLRVVFWFSD